MELRRVNPLLGFEEAVVASGESEKVSMGGINFGLVDLEFFRANVLLISRPSMEPRREKDGPPPPDDLFFDCDESRGGATLTLSLTPSIGVGGGSRDNEGDDDGTSTPPPPPKPRFIISLIR
jgi:hypothetical protein